MPFFPTEDRRHLSISPIHGDLKDIRDEGRMPPVVFECGTQDCLLEDTVLMALSWQMAGGVSSQTVLRSAAWFSSVSAG